MSLSTFQNIPFTNIDSEDFIGYWGGEEIGVRTNQTVNLPPFLAKHMAKCLTDKILLREANQWVKNHASNTPQEKSKEPSWMDVTLREPLTSKMLGWTVEKLREELELDEKGKKKEVKEETVLKSDVEKMVAEQVAKIMSGQNNAVDRANQLSSISEAIVAEEFPGLEEVKKRGRPAKAIVE